MNTRTTANEGDFTRRLFEAKIRLMKAETALSRAEVRKMAVKSRWFPVLGIGGTGLGLVALGMLFSRL